MSTKQRLDELEEEIARLRGEWKAAPTRQDREIIETRAKLLIWAKQKIEASLLQPDLYQTAQAIFSGGNDRPAKTSSAGSEYDSGPGEDTSG